MNRSAFFSFWALAAICLWNLNGVTAIAFGVTRLLSVMILGFGLVVLSKSREPWAQSLGRPGIWFAVMIIVYLSFGATSHFESSLVISHINSLFVVLAAAVGTAYIAPRIGLHRFMVLIAIFSSIGALTVFLSPFLRPLYRQLEKTDVLINAGRWMGFFANPNETGMAGVYALSASLSVLTLTPRESKVRRLLPLIVVALAVGVFLTFSRGAMIAFALVTSLYVFLAVKLNAQSIKLIIAAVVVAISFYLFFTQGYKFLSWTPEQFNRIKSVERILTGEKTSSRDLGGRTSGMRAGLHYWQKEPIFGHGLGTLHKMPTRYFRGLGCHNTHVMFLGEVGVVGFMFYLAFWASLLTKSHAHPYPIVRQFCLMITMTLLLNGMVGHNLLSNRNSNFLLGAVLGLASIPLPAWGKNEGDEELDEFDLQPNEP